MERFLLCFYLLLLFAVGYRCVEFRQERAKVTYTNPKYIANLSVLTRRVSRHEPYRTNLTGTTLVPYGNNVTFTLILQLKSGGDFKIAAKACDCVKTKWMRTYMSKFTNLTLDKCPFQPGTYAYINMELPPKNVPIPVMDGDYYSIMELSITDTKEKIFSVGTLLHFDAYNNDKNKDNKNKDRNKSSDNKDNKNKDNMNKDRNKSNDNKDNKNKDNKNKDNKNNDNRNGDRKG